MLRGTTIHVIPPVGRRPDKVCFCLSRGAMQPSFSCFFGCSAHLTCPSLHSVRFFCRSKTTCWEMHRLSVRSFCPRRRTCSAKGAPRRLLDINHRFHEGEFLLPSPFCNAVSLAPPHWQEEEKQPRFFPTCIDAGRCSATFFLARKKLFSLPFPAQEGVFGHSSRRLSPLGACIAYSCLCDPHCWAFVVIQGLTLFAHRKNV